MINDRQFILSKAPYIKDGWKHETLSNGYVLSWHHALNAVFNDEKNMALLGWAWEADAEKDSPAEQISRLSDLSEKHLIDMEKTWCGRYLLIVGDKIYLDATGLLGVFYSDDMVSSSLNVMCEIKDIKLKFPKIAHEFFPNFIPGTYTEYNGIKRLLPSQLLNYVTHSIETRKLLPDGLHEGLSENERTKKFIQYFSTSLKNLVALFPDREIWLALSGGRDSRTTMAMLEYAGIDYKTYTLEHWNISQGDIKLPPILAEKVHKEHIYVKRDPKKYSEKRRQDYDIQCAGAVDDADKLFQSYGQYQVLEDEKNLVLLRSCVYTECSAEEYGDIFSHDFDANKITSEKAIKNLFNSIALEYNEQFSKALLNWFSLVAADEVNDLKIRDRFELDLHLPCWLSTIEQSFDLLDNIISLQPLNCRVFIGLFMGYTGDTRKGKKYEEIITSAACPALNGIPYDEVFNVGSRSKFRKNKKRIQRIFKSMRMFGVMITVGWLCRKILHKLRT